MVCIFKTRVTKRHRQQFVVENVILSSITDYVSWFQKTLLGISPVNITPKMRTGRARVRNVRKVLAMMV